MKKKLEIVHPYAAGIDIGSKNFYVDAGEESIRVFPTFTEDCNTFMDYCAKASYLVAIYV